MTTEPPRQPDIDPDRLRKILRDWREHGETSIADAYITVSTETHHATAGTLPDAVALLLGLIEVGEQL